MNKPTVPGPSEVTVRSVPNVTPEQLAARKAKKPTAELQFLMKLHERGNTANGRATTKICLSVRGARLTLAREFMERLERHQEIEVERGKSQTAHNNIGPVIQTRLTLRGLERLRREYPHTCGDECSPLPQDLS